MRAKGLQQFLRFGVVGAVGFVVDAGMLYASAPVLGWYGARVLSFLTAATATWFLNRRFTFVDVAATEASPSTATKTAAPKSVGRQYTQYLLSMLLGGCVNYAVYAATLHWIHVPYAALLGVALGSCAGLGVNYVTASRFVFLASPPRR